MKVESVAIKSLTMDPENARTHSEKNIKAIAGSLTTFGQRKPLVVWGDIVIAGNGTIEAAKSIGWEKIEITRVPSDWSHDQARAFALADNRTAELAEWDSEILATQLIDLDSVGYEIGDWGFEPLQPPDGTEWDGMGDSVTDRQPFQQITFSLSDEQADTVRDAIDRAKKLGEFGDTGNENSNGNALARIAEIFIGQNL